MTDSAFVQRVLTVIGLVLAVGLLLALFCLASDVFILLFASILFAVLLRAPTNWLAHYTPLSENTALLLATLLLLAVMALLVYLFAAPLGDQLGQLVQTLPRALARVLEWSNQHSWSKPLGALINDIRNVKLDLQLLGRASGVISSTFEAVAGLFVVFFIGIYLATQPRLYQHGFMRLLPLNARPRAREVLDQIGTTLRWWLLGRLITMTVVGTAAGVGLWWLGIPLAFTLGILTGLLEFIPYIGPILAALPALLVAFNLDPMQAFYVGLLFIVIQSGENYLLSPLIEQRTISLPPALVIFSTLLLATLFGGLGVIIASPLTATCLVAVNLLYIQDMGKKPV